MNVEIILIIKFEWFIQGLLKIIKNQFYIIVKMEKLKDKTKDNQIYIYKINNGYIRNNSKIIKSEWSERNCRRWLKFFVFYIIKNSYFI